MFALSVYWALGTAQFLLYKRDLAQQSSERGTHICLVLTRTWRCREQLWVALGGTALLSYRIPIPSLPP